MPIDSSIVELGSVSGPIRSFVDPDEVVAFALAIDDHNPRYLTRTAVPPTYSVVPALPVIHGLPAYRPEVAEATRATVHAEHDIVVHNPIVPGTWLNTSAERVGVIPTKAGMVVNQVVRVVDDEGELLVEQHWVVMLICDATGVPRGMTPPEHGFPEVARQRLVGSVTLSTSRDQTFRYAGASGDRNPMHVNDEVARARGFLGKFNQGLCTLGIATRGLIDIAAEGDPARVARVAVRFSAPAFPGDNIELAVYKLAKSADGMTTFVFEANAGERTVLRHGRVDVRPTTRGL